MELGSKVVCYTGLMDSLDFNQYSINCMELSQKQDQNHQALDNRDLTTRHYNGASYDALSVNI
jgi:hypothetical protein